jgi:L-histidine N-alpha-methyltransferase
MTEASKPRWGESRREQSTSSAWAAVAVKDLGYTPSDVSTAMVLVARQAALNIIPEDNCLPLVCDLAIADDLPAVLDQMTPPRPRPPSPSLPHASRVTPQTPRLLTFFGMIPNFEPAIILPRLAALVRPGDLLLFSANLAPGPDYAAGVQRVLPLYDNDLTRDWLLTFLFDLGVERSDGHLRFTIEGDPTGSGLKRIAAYFHFERSRQLRLEEQRFDFLAGDAIRLFFSYRHTPEKVRQLLHEQGLEVLGQWITSSGEEGVFLVHQLARNRTG